MSKWRFFDRDGFVLWLLAVTADQDVTHMAGPVPPSPPGISISPVQSS